MAENYDLYYINKRMADSSSDFIADCELHFRNAVEDAVNTVVSHGCRIMMLAGPSSSGKTTTAALISAFLHGKDGRAYTVSLDDFYLDNGTGPKNPDGTNDYESVQALDVPCICHCLDSLLRFGKTELPVFDFQTGKRKEQWQQIVPAKNDLLIIEGLHALNPVITDNLPKDDLCLAYISVSSRVCTENEIYFNKRDLRFLRRLVRDYQFRATSPESTFEMWPQVLSGEDRFLFPYKDSAQLRINSFHPYEPCVLAAAAIPLLDSVSDESPFFRKATVLSQKLKGFVSADKSRIPSDSLLHEFLG